MGKKILTFLSYVMVAIIASVITICLLGGESIPMGNKLVELENLITERFIGDCDKTEMEDAAAYAMVDAIGDRWSYYIPASEYAAHLEQVENAYVGIGITIELHDEGLLITKVNSDSPARDAGMQAGDYIVKVNGQMIKDIGLDGAKKEIRGAEGTKVEITVTRDGAELVFSVERRRILADVATCEMLPDGIGLIRIENFDSRCADMTLACVEKMRAEGAKALIFDVRFNPGGFKSELVEILDYLLPEGPLFRSVDYRGNENVDMSDAAHLDMPMVVLVNGESYSAAEFFAAALREYDAAFVVGTKTCGKGYFQNTFRLSDGSAVGLSVGKYFTPNGISLAGEGLTPDYLVEVDDQMMLDIYAGKVPAMEDPQILAAIRALKERNIP